MFSTGTQQGCSETLWMLSFRFKRYNQWRFIPVNAELETRCCLEAGSYNLRAVMVRGIIKIIGGFNEAVEYWEMIYDLDPQTHYLTMDSQILPDGTRGMAAAFFSGKIWSFGGRTESGYTRSRSYFQLLSLLPFCHLTFR